MPNVSAHNFIKQTLLDLKAQTELSTMIAGDFSTHFHQQIDHPAAVQYTFFSTTYRIFYNIDHILGHKASLSKCMKVEITPCILSDHYGIKLEVNRKRSNRKIQTPED
jgi:endonuclease/exonuclease/phosphatase family metal-dependent hydrolase